MPTYVIDAVSWDFNQNLDDAFAASGYRVRYRKETAGHEWDGLVFANVKPYRGGMPEDTFVIQATTDGLTDTLVEGIVDENVLIHQGRARDGDLVGRDKAALGLQGYPLAALTIPGFVVHRHHYIIIVDGQIVDEYWGDWELDYSGAWMLTEALSRLCQDVGLSVSFDNGILNYTIGKSLPIPTDKVIGEAINELLTPLRWSEKHRVDVWVDGTTVHFAKRNYTAPPRGAITVDFNHLINPQIRKTSLDAVTDVCVEGASYEWPEVVVQMDDGGNPVAGAPYIAPYSIAESQTVELVVQGIIAERYTESSLEEYTGAGQLWRKTLRRIYDPSIGAIPKFREEETIATSTYNVAPGTPMDGLKTSEVEEYKVKDTTGSRVLTMLTVVKRKKSLFTYYDDTGEPKTEDVTEYEYDETGTPSGLPLSLPLTTQRNMSYRWRRSYYQLYREWLVVEIDATTGEVTRTFGSGEVAPASSGITRYGAGEQTTTKNISACDAEALPPVRKESNELIGTTADAQAIRADIADEHNSIRVGFSSGIHPDIRIKAGMLMTIQNAPADWPMTSFYLTSVNWTGAGKTQTLSVEGLNWVAA